jgi:hypothetical protein
MGYGRLLSEEMCARDGAACESEEMCARDGAACESEEMCAGDEAACETETRAIVCLAERDSGSRERS